MHVFDPVMNTDNCESQHNVIMWQCHAHIIGSCSSGGRVGGLLITEVVAQSLAPLVHMTKCPWARRRAPKFFLNKHNTMTTILSSCRAGNSSRLLLAQEEGHGVRGSRGAFVLQDGPVTFRFAICSDALSVGIDVREPTGGAHSLRAHLPVLLQSAVPCGAPDVIGGIIHTHTLMKVSIWPLTRTH